MISPLKRASLMTGLNDNPQQNYCRPLCAAYDADSGGNVADIPALVTLLASMGVSMIVIEDKSVSEPGKKVNSLKETSGLQGQANMYDFADIIRTFTSASAHKERMIAARIESFTVRIVKTDEDKEKASVQGALRDALTRAEVYRNAGADAIMIHSKSILPDEVSSFLTEYRSKDSVTPLVVVPTTYSEPTENALYHAGANIIIYANHLMRAKIYAIGEFSGQFLAEKPDFFSQNAELSACLRARNFGCLLQKLLSKDWGEEAKRYRVVAEKRATENMSAVVKCLLDCKMSGAADTRIISVGELLKINAHQVSDVEKLD
jgi:phosphoenolpyruvate phosphomutase